MNDQSPTFFFDAVDPLSFDALHRALIAAEEQRDVSAVRTPIESYPADATLTDTPGSLLADALVDILRARQQAVQAGVTSAPALVTRTGTLQGFHNQAAIGTLLDGR